MAINGPHSGAQLPGFTSQPCYSLAWRAPAVPFWASITLSEKWGWYQHLPRRGAIRISQVNKYKGLRTPSTGIRLWSIYCYCLVFEKDMRGNIITGSSNLLSTCQHSRRPLFVRSLSLAWTCLPLPILFKRSRKPWGSHFERELLRKIPSNLLEEKEQYLNRLKSQPASSSCTSRRGLVTCCSVIWSRSPGCLLCESGSSQALVFCAPLEITYIRLQHKFYLKQIPNRNIPSDHLRTSEFLLPFLHGYLNISLAKSSDPFGAMLRSENRWPLNRAP